MLQSFSRAELAPAGEIVAGFSRAELAPTVGIVAGLSRAELGPTVGIVAGLSRVELAPTVGLSQAFREQSSLLRYTFSQGFRGLRRSHEKKHPGVGRDDGVGFRAE